MSTRPSVNLSDLVSEVAAPMTEAVQRGARQAPTPTLASKGRATAKAAEAPTKTANLQALAFKVSPAFRKRFRQRAADADLKLNELLFEALDAWEAARGLKR